MDLFEIQTGSGNTAVGLVYFYEKSDTCIIELASGMRAEKSPAGLADFIRKGILTLDPFSSRKYVEEDLAGDGCRVRALKTEPLWMAHRREKWLTAATPLSGNRYFLAFQDGRCGAAEIRPVGGKPWPAEQIFSGGSPESAAVRLAAGGRVLDFGEGRFRMSTALYGLPLDGRLQKADVISVLKQSLVDVPDLCRELGVSRQYINRRLKEEGIRPFRKCGANNLYLRSQVQALLDY